MSREAVGQNGAVLGSDMYWNQLNSSTILGGLMQWASGTEYYRTLQEAATRASTAIEEIYDDLQQNIDRICFVPSSPRSTLAKQVESLYNVCEMAGILKYAQPGLPTHLRTKGSFCFHRSLYGKRATNCPSENQKMH